MIDVPELHMDFSQFSSTHPLAKGDFDDAPVPPVLLEKIKVNNVILRMNQGVKAKTHDCKSCLSCLNQEGNIREQEFLRKLKNKLDEENINKKLENHMLKHNTVTLVGEIAASLPKLSEDRDVIWNKLLKDTQMFK